MYLTKMTTTGTQRKTYHQFVVHVVQILLQFQRMVFQRQAMHDVAFATLHHKDSFFLLRARGDDDVIHVVP